MAALFHFRFLLKIKVCLVVVYTFANLFKRSN